MTIYKHSLVSNRPGSGHNIRLLELLPDSSNQPIRCNIYHANLDDISCPSYDALSYCWGDAVSTETIIVDGASSLEVTANLHSALKHIRDTNLSKALWVDAICINQHDTAEKNEQVALMPYIYSSAHNVTIWLGDESQNSRAAFGLMYDISVTKEIDELRGVEGRNLWDLSRPDDGLPLTTNPIWYDLFAIIQRPWFRRAWVIQELAMAPQATVMCGENKILWDELEQVFKYLVVSGFALAFAPVALSHFLVLSHARGVARSKVTQPALHVLMRHRQTLASDPRDKVFAFGGLCSATHDDSLAIKPDYGTDFREIYTMFAVSTLLNSQNLDILSVPRVQETSLGTGLPSWVPDWSVFDRATSLQGWEALVDKKWIIAPRYVATGLSKCKPIFSNNHTRLGLRGIIVERILHAGPECRSKLDQDDLAKTNDLNFVIHSQRVLKIWEDISACRIFWWHYPTGEKLMDVYWQTLLAGHLYESFEKTQQIFQRWDQTNQAFRCLQLVYLDRPWFLTMIIYGMSLVGGIAWFLGWMGVFNYMLNFSPETLFKTIAWPMLNRRLFKTESGYIGIGPKLIRGGLDGDHIALCEGGALPLIVRPNGNDWEIKGDCYIHGWMNGEPYEILKDDMKMMWFV